MVSEILLIVGSLVLSSPPEDPWPPCDVSVFEGQRMRQYEDDVANVDFHVSVVNKHGHNELDVGIDGRSFALNELERFFWFQRHKGFVLVSYDKNGPSGELGDSILELKGFFLKAGYQRILFTLGYSSGVIILEDFRVKTEKEADSKVLAQPISPQLLEASGNGGQKANQKDASILLWIVVACVLSGTAWSYLVIRSSRRSPAPTPKKATV